MNKSKFILLTAGLMLALAFTFSCSSDDVSGSGGGSDNSEEVISTYTNINTSYNSDGTIASSLEYRGEYSYNNGKKLILFHNGMRTSEYEYDANGEILRIIAYDANGNILGYTKYKTTKITISSIEYTKQQITESYDSGENRTGYSRMDYDYDCNNDGSFCVITVTLYNAEGIVSITSAGQKCTFTTINSKKLKTSIVSTDSNGVETGSKVEYEYDSKGNTTKTTLYRLSPGTNSYVKYSESVTQYTYRKI